ncbi:DUF1643 domain-containing protein [Ferdinandcohnia sp. SAFN-114]|uniref:DUF1643 domain-containing protein n=1 Tax=Ferdinandcohnia sp. SAFN-114 TaxID=3387275 RepID=UPI003F7F13D0
MKRRAIFDPSRTYRYSMSRIWDESKKKIVFIMLNPSIANETADDNTTKKCITFAKKFGYGSLEIINLFAYVATDYNELKNLSREVAIGKENIDYIIRAVNSADKIVAAWGENGTIHQRNKDIENLLRGYDIDCLKVTARGFPSHPLFLSYKCELIPYRRPNKKSRILIRTVPDENLIGREGIIKSDGKIIGGDSWLWCKVCHSEFPLEGTTVCKDCIEILLDKYFENTSS